MSHFFSFSPHFNWHIKAKVLSEKTYRTLISCGFLNQKMAALWSWRQWKPLMLGDSFGSCITDSHPWVERELDGWKDEPPEWLKGLKRSDLMVSCKATVWNASWESAEIPLQSQKNLEVIKKDWSFMGNRISLVHGSGVSKLWPVDQIQLQ